MSSGLRSTSSSPSRKSMRPFSGNDSLELQRRNPSRVPASGGMHSGSLTDKDGFLGMFHTSPERSYPGREAPASTPGAPAARWVYTRRTETRGRGMLAPRWHTRHLVAWLALAATIGGGVACSGGAGGRDQPLRLAFHSDP